jgi:hypothetical protein
MTRRSAFGPACRAVLVGGGVVVGISPHPPRRIGREWDRVTGRVQTAHDRGSHDPHDGGEKT